jgi:hypothetical protein
MHTVRIDGERDHERCGVHELFAARVLEVAIDVTLRTLKGDLRDVARARRTLHGHVRTERSRRSIGVRQRMAE